MLSLSRDGRPVPSTAGQQRARCVVLCALLSSGAARQARRHRPGRGQAGVAGAAWEL